MRSQLSLGLALGSPGASDAELQQAAAELGESPSFRARLAGDIAASIPQVSPEQVEILSVAVLGDAATPGGSKSRGRLLLEVAQSGLRTDGRRAPDAAAAAARRTAESPVVQLVVDFRIRIAEGGGGAALDAAEARRVAEQLSGQGFGLAVLDNLSRSPIDAGAGGASLVAVSAAAAPAAVEGPGSAMMIVMMLIMIVLKLMIMRIMCIICISVACIFYTRLNLRSYFRN